MPIKSFVEKICGTEMIPERSWTENHRRRGGRNPSVESVRGPASHRMPPLLGVIAVNFQLHDGRQPSF